MSLSICLCSYAALSLLVVSCFKPFVFMAQQPYRFPGHLKTVTFPYPQRPASYLRCNGWKECQLVSLDVQIPSPSDHFFQWKKVASLWSSSQLASTFESVGFKSRAQVPDSRQQKSFIRRAAGVSRGRLKLADINAFAEMMEDGASIEDVVFEALHSNRQRRRECWPTQTMARSQLQQMENVPEESLVEHTCEFPIHGIIAELWLRGLVTTKKAYTSILHGLKANAIALRLFCVNTSSNPPIMRYELRDMKLVSELYDRGMSITDIVLEIESSYSRPWNGKIHDAKTVAAILWAMGRIEWADLVDKIFAAEAELLVHRRLTERPHTATTKARKQLRVISWLKGLTRLAAPSDEYSHSNHFSRPDSSSTTKSTY